MHKVHFGKFSLRALINLDQITQGYSVWRQYKNIFLGTVIFLLSDFLKLSKEG